MKTQLKKYTKLLLEGNAHLFSMAGFRAEINKIKKNREYAFCQYHNFKFIDELDVNEELYEGNAASIMDEQNEYLNLSRIIPEDEIDEQDDFDYDLGAGGYMQEH